MAFQKTHELHQRRLGRNVGVLLTLVAFAALIFGITIAKVAGGSLMEGYDHQPRASQLPPAEPAR